MKVTHILVAFCILFSSCQPSLDYNLSGYTQKIIVEGYITSNDFAKVYLSFNIPLSQKIDSTQMLKNFISVAKVTVSDGIQSEVLTGGYWNKNHFPPFYYSTTNLKGREGGTYTISVVYAGHELYAKTTIPYSDSVTNFQTTSVNDSMRMLKMGIDINTNTKGAYRIYSLKPFENTFTPTPFLFNSDLSLKGYNVFAINPKPTQNMNSLKESNLFRAGDAVLIQVDKMDSISTVFFKGISFGGDNGLGSDIFIGQKDVLKSNISSPGYGIWCGIARRTYPVEIK